MIDDINKAALSETHLVQCNLEVLVPHTPAADASDHDLPICVCDADCLSVAAPLQVAHGALVTVVDQFLRPSALSKRTSM